LYSPIWTTCKSTGKKRPNRKLNDQVADDEHLVIGHDLLDLGGVSRAFISESMNAADAARSVLSQALRSLFFKFCTYQSAFNDLAGSPKLSTCICYTYGRAKGNKQRAYRSA
jgi:hypothetical protein